MEFLSRIKDAGKRKVSFPCVFLLYIQEKLIFCQNYPRMRGEKIAMEVREDDEEGSPPRVRGKGVLHHRSPVPLGITPACAGKRAPATRARTLSRNHPRMRGEKLQHRQRIGRLPGSPPHARGKDRVLKIRDVPGGITPACGGKSCPWFSA